MATSSHDLPDWSAVPIFGTPDPALPLRVRPSAYAIVRDSAGEIVIVQTRRGFYLPGGGCDPGETAVATVERETIEETGFEVAVGTWRRAAIEHVPTARKGASFEKRCTFCDAVLVRDTGRASEPDHVAVWTTPDDAIARLLRASHRWAVAEWLSDHSRTSVHGDRG
jgi:8-oxo-dGTP diphosphatase